MFPPQPPVPGTTTDLMQRPDISGSNPGIVYMSHTDKIPTHKAAILSPSGCDGVESGRAPDQRFYPGLLWVLLSTWLIPRLLLSYVVSNGQGPGAVCPPSLTTQRQASYRLAYGIVQRRLRHIFIE